MLTFCFFTAVFLSISWLMYMGTYIYSHLNGVSLSALGLTDLAVYTLLAVVPLFVIWMVWNAFYRFRHEKNLQRQFKNIEAQIKQNQEFFEMAARMLWQARQSGENHFVLSQTELFVNELNSLLADMLQRYNFISDSEAARLWSTTEKGNKWSFAKALISLQNGSVDFDNRLYRAALRENLLRGTINEFCARYARLLDLLKSHDREKMFLSVIETGALGKAFAILAPLADRLQQNTAAETAATAEPELFADTELRIVPATQAENNETTEKNDEEDPLAELEELNLAELFGEDEVVNTETRQEERVIAEDKPLVAETDAKSAHQAKQETEPAMLVAPKDEAETKVEEETASVEDEIERMFAGAGIRGEDESETADKASFFPKFSNLFKRKPIPEQPRQPETEIDPLTLALERSFGKLADTAPHNDSRLYKMMNAEEVGNGVGESGADNKFAFAGTNETIAKLQEELKKLKNPESGSDENTKAENGAKQDC